MAVTLIALQRSTGLREDMIPRKFSSFFICISIVLSSTVIGCNKKEDEAEMVVGSDQYSCSAFDIPMRENYEIAYSNVLMDENKYCISVLYKSVNSSSYLTDIFTLDEGGELQFVLEMPGSQMPSAVFSNEYAYIGARSADVMKAGENASGLECLAVFFEKETGEVTRTVTTDFTPISIEPISNGFVIGGTNDIAKYNSDGTLLKTAHSDCMISFGKSFFEENGECFFVEQNYEDFSLVFHRIDFNEGICKRVISNKEISENRPRFQGKYCFETDGEYILNFDSLSLDKVVDWNCIDIRPPQKALKNIEEYIPLDEKHFAITYSYSDGTSEVLLFSYNPSVRASQRIKITIGGCGVYEDISLKWLVYQFNISNTKYRVVLDELGRFFSGVEVDEVQRGQLSLMKYFEEGHTPDIFYGYYFNYDYMGRNGMLADLKPYLDTSPEILSELTDTARKLMLNKDEKCYQIFASYWMNGNIGLKSHFNQGNNVSVFDIQKKAKELEMPMYAEWGGTAENIVESAIFNDFIDVWGINDGEKKVKIDDLKKLLDLAVDSQASLPDNSGSTEARGIADDYCLLCNATVFDLPSFARLEKDYNERICFVGSPSFDGSVHLAMPSCCLALSTTAYDPEVCWQLMSGLFSSEVQKIAAANGEMPVNQEILDMVCKAFLDPEAVTDGIIKSLVAQGKELGQTKLTQEIIDDYLEIVYSADTLSYQDRRLYLIIREEVNSFYSQNRSTSQIAETLMQRLDLYAKENYQ